MIKTVMQPVKPHKKFIGVDDMDEFVLNWAVAHALGETVYRARKRAWLTKPIGKYDSSHKMPYWSPTTRWEQAGPIIEREKIDLFTEKGTPESWVASVARYQNGERLVGWRIHQYGPTPLIAAMRCLVASRLGEQVEVPNELMTVL